MRTQSLIKWLFTRSDKTYPPQLPKYPQKVPKVPAKKCQQIPVTMAKLPTKSGQNNHLWQSPNPRHREPALPNHSSPPQSPIWSKLVDNHWLFHLRK